ncbi:MAG: hypothetical protein RR867_02960 [Ruthenibacterium sp.]
MYQYGHYCVPVASKPEDAAFVPLLGCYVTDCAQHPMSFEFLYIPDDNKILPPELKTRPHLAFNVDNFDALLSQSRILYQFICPYDNVSRVAFVEYQGAVLELKEVSFK